MNKKGNNLTKNNDKERRLQHQLYLAKENPEPILDISDCDLTKIPTGCFSLCKVLRKRKFLIQNNRLRDLSCVENKLVDLTVVTHIYLDHNELISVPSQIAHVHYLEVFYAGHNKLTGLPDSMGTLQFLRKLIVPNNQLFTLPATILHRDSKLERIDVSENPHFKVISPNIGQLPNLKGFYCSTDYLSYPTEIRSKTVPEIIQYIITESGGTVDEDWYARLCMDNQDQDDIGTFNTGLLDYENYKQSRIQFLQSIENECHYNAIGNDCLFIKANMDKDSLLKIVLQEEARVSLEIGRLHREREQRQLRVLDDVKVAEAEVARLLADIAALDKACCHHEQAVECMHSRAIDDVGNTSYERQLQTLRKQEIIDGMSAMLLSHGENEEASNRMTESHKVGRACLREAMRRTRSEDDKAVNRVLDAHSRKQQELVRVIAQEEAQQKQALLELQLRKDGRAARLREEVSWVHAELAMLSGMEQRRRTLRQETEVARLAERRHQLVHALSALMQQQRARQCELQKRLVEMEDQREKNQTDFWLVQYQRLLDRKPFCFQEESCGLDDKVVEVLQVADCMEYLPFFQAEHVTWLTLLLFTEKDCTRLHIYNPEKRKLLLRVVDEEQKKKEKSCAEDKTWHKKRAQKLEKRQQGDGAAEASEAPSTSETGVAAATAPSVAAVVNIHQEVECCICLENDPSTLFLECGHVCCCAKCAATVLECPLCRQPIARVLRLAGFGPANF